MKKSQKINEKGINHQNTPKILELSLNSGCLRDLLVHHSNEINQFSTQKRGEIEWLPLGRVNGVQVDFIDRKIMDKKDDKLLLFKNINIPTIKVKDAKLQCQTAHFFSFRNAENEGQLRSIELKTKSNAFSFDLNGDCLVQHIRFKETSFHHRGEQFQLIIALKNYNNELISAFVSSPFLVESRKKPFQERAHKEQNISTLYDPFLPSILEKKYNIQGSQTDSTSKSNMIGEDLKSLIVYFSAQNIRHKIIHPLYLLFKFPQAISLFYNNHIISEENITPERLIRQIQQQIFQILLSDSNQEQNVSSERLLILCLKSNINNINHTKDLVKVSKYMSFLEGPTLTFLEKTPTDLPPEFKLMNNIEELKIAYSKVYSEIAKLKIEIKMRQEKYNEKSYHSIIESRGGIPSKEQFQSISRSIEYESSNSWDMAKAKKNIFHHICYDLQIKDSNIKSTLLKVPIQMISRPILSKKDSQMEIELNPKKKQSNSLSRADSNSKISIQDSYSSQQKSDHKIFQEDEDSEESIQLNCIRREIEQLNDITKQSNDQKQSCEQITKISSFRWKKQNENQIQVIFQCQENSKRELDDTSYLTKRRNTSYSNKKQLKSQNDSLLKEEKIIEQLPQKKRKLQTNLKQGQCDQSINVDANNSQKKQQSIQNQKQNIDTKESVISGKLETLHLGQQLKHFHVNKTAQINFKQTEIEKKEQQGNTSSTASTINRAISKLDHGHHKNNSNNSSSSSSSAVNKNCNIYKRNSNISQSSSDTQNINNELGSMNDEGEQLYQKINNLNENYINKNIHCQNKMEIEFLYEQLQNETSKNKFKNDSKAQQIKYNDLTNILNGYESDLSQQNDEIENENNNNHTENPQNKTNFECKIEQYLKGYDNDDEFDYQNEEEEDGDLSLDQLTNKQKKYSSFKRNFSNSDKTFQSSSSLHQKFNNSFGNEIKLHKKDQQQKRNKHQLQGKKTHTELLKLLKEQKKHQKNYQSCDENQSNMIED